MEPSTRKLLRLWIAFGGGILIIAWANGAFGHPGGLDKKGCHKVHEDFEYESGKVLKKGTEHCHRGIGAMKLDGKEALEDFRDNRPVTKEKTK